MNLFNDLFLLQRIDHLVRTRATGTPVQLAERLGISERKLYRLISELRDQGFPITYDKPADTYYYSEPVKIEFSILVGQENLMIIRGGEI
jgi:predicted DNA-binding transcriptional regulator YafY